MSQPENDLLRRMPKTDTHCHLDGSLRVETALEFASVERIAYELIEDCAKENIRHVEVRDAPVIHAHEKFTAVHFIEAALR